MHFVPEREGSRCPSSRWRRLQAVLLRADEVPVATVAQTLDCAETSVYNWVAAWRSQGLTGVAEGVHLGKARRLDPEAEALLNAPPHTPRRSRRPPPPPTSPS